MGTAIGTLLEKEEIDLNYLDGKKIGVDGYNVIYQFLTTIRGLDGELLTTTTGVTTSHIIGLFHRLANILEHDTKVLFSFDGKAIDLKKETLEKRKDIKIDAKAKADSAKTDKERKMYLSRTAKIDDNIINSTKELLDAFGIPSINAISDGEAQLAYMNNLGDIDAVVSQDYDSLLFGAKNSIRNLTVSGKKKMPGKDYYVQIKPELINLDTNLVNLGISREKLIWIGILIGTDFNNKVPKVGPKTAIKLVREFDSFEDILEKLEYEPDFDYNEIEQIFTKPQLIKDYNIKYNSPDFDKLKEILIEKYEFHPQRTNSTLERLEDIITKREKQNKLSKWF